MEKLRELIQETRTFFTMILLAVIVVGAVVLSFMHLRSSTPRITSDLIEERLEFVQDLVGIEYYYKDVSSIEKAKFQKFGISIPFTGSRAILSFEGVIKYGIDVSQVQVDVSGSKVTLTIPKAKLISHEIPEKNIEVFDQGKNIFNPVTIGDYVNFQAEQKVLMEARAEERGFPAMAEQKSGESLCAILEAMPGMEKYTVSVQYS